MTDPLPLAIAPVGHEEHVWVAENDGLSTRAQVSAGSGPYASTVPAKIVGLAPDVPSDLAADVEVATSELTRFDAYARAALGVDSPALGPMASVLLRTESASSSQ
ncbi:MAG: cell filamentation protein Fic, partial [Oerskovia sp.]|nr:cell filamentation protein Fic [Oerskovia sp.]